MNEAPDDRELDRMRRLVSQREVCWDVFRENVGFVEGGVKSVGYQLVLSGIHEDDGHPPLPGCELCVAVYDDLKTLASWALPKVHRQSVYEIEPFHAEIHATKKRNLRSEIDLTIHILHRHHYEAPVDECETRCLVETEKRLRRAWACKGAWEPLEPRGLSLEKA